MSPCKQINHGHIGGEIEDPFISQHTVDQWNSDKAAIGIDRAKAVEIIIRVIFLRHQKTGNQNGYDMGSKSGRKCGQKTSDKSGVIVCLIYSNNPSGVDNHKEQIGYTSVSFLAHDLQPVAGKRQYHNNEHFQQLIKN